MSCSIQSIRNIGIIAHIDAGKTTLTERMLYCSGTTHRLGNVDKGTTETDFDEEEQQRGITIYSACVSFPWNDISINLIDTPGHVDFTAEVERSLRVLDGGVVIFSAREGVEAQSETVWRQADRYHVPRIALINKMDREGADFDATFSQIIERLGAKPVAIQIPVGAGPPHLDDAFSGIIDLIAMKKIVFPRLDEDDAVRAFETVDIPEEDRARAQSWREKLLESLYDFSDELMELALQDAPVPVTLLNAILREATIHLRIQPVLCGSALDGIGIQPLLDAVACYLPSPADMPPVKGPNPKPDKKKEPGTVVRHPTLDEPFCGLVFKVIPAKTGDMSYIRVYSGELKANTRAYNPGKDAKENIAQLWHIQAARREQIPEAQAGDIVGIIGLRHSITGDTLCDAKSPILLESIEFPETVLSIAIEPANATERKKLSETLEMMKRQDPTFQASEDEETGQTIISGMGELHLEVLQHRLLRDFKLDIKFHKPRVSYRETIGRTIEVTGECHRLVAGTQLFAKVRLRLEPREKSTIPVQISTACDPEELSGEYLAVVLDELRACSEGGGSIGGFPLSKLRVTVLGGEQNEEQSTEVAFRIAASDAFRQGLEQGGPLLLEPMMKVDIHTPEQYLGDFVGDLQKRRATIARTDVCDGRAIIEAHAPLAELFGYSGAMRSLSQGRAGCSIEPLAYAPAPASVAKSFGMG